MRTVWQSCRAAALTGMLAACGAALPLAAQAAAPLVSATLEPQQIAVGEAANLTITSSGNGLEGVKLPQVPGLEFRVVGQSRRIEIINGATLNSTSVMVRVTPQAPGVYTIPGITQQPIVLRVTAAGSAPGGSAPFGSTNGTGAAGGGANGIRFTPDGSAYIRLVLPKRDIYVGESIPVDIELGMRDGFVSSLNGLPTLTGGDFTLNNLSHQPERLEKTVDGKPFTVYQWHSVIAAVKPGKFSLAVESPLTVRVRTRPQRDSMIEDMLGDPFLQNFFGATVPKDITVTSPPAELTVLELPAAGRPANFSGAVGQFRLSAELSSTAAAAGDPITLRMHVTGSGNFDRVDSSMLEHLDDWKTYPPRSTFKPADPQGTKGEKTFEQPLIAEQPGTQTLPPLTFSYFDPTSKHYETVKSTPLEVTISPAAGAAARGAAPTAGMPATAPPPAAVAPTASSGLRLMPDHAATGDTSATLMPLYFQPLFLAAPSLLIAALAGGWFAHRRRAAGAARPWRGSPKSVERRLADLAAAAQRRDSPAFFALARTLLLDTLAARWGVPPEHIGPAELEARLDGHAEVRQLLALADEASYSGHAPSGTDFERWMATVRGVLRDTPASAPAAVTALCLGLLLAGTGSGLAAFPARAAALAAGSASGTGYSAAELYNRGNAAARAGKTGLAVLDYERARLLTPNDPDLEANLQRVRSAAHLAADPQSGFEHLALALNPSVLAWLGVLGIAVAGTALFMERRLAWLRRGAALLGLVLVAWTVSNATVLWPVIHEAVVLAAATPARVSPVPMGDPLFVLPEGESVEIRAAHDDFLLVRTRAGRTGWVSRGSIEPVVPYY